MSTTFQIEGTDRLPTVDGSVTCSHDARERTAAFTLFFSATNALDIANSGRILAGRPESTLPATDDIDSELAADWEFQGRSAEQITYSAAVLGLLGLVAVICGVIFLSF